MSKTLQFKTAYKDDIGYIVHPTKTAKIKKWYYM